MGGALEHALRSGGSNPACENSGPDLRGDRPLLFRKLNRGLPRSARRRLL